MAGAAWAARALTTSGAAAAWSVGTLVLVGTGWEGGAVLAAFFVSSTAVSRITAARVPARGDVKGERRDHWQVYANGGAAALGSLAGWHDPSLAIWLVTASLAAAAADTWATSVGGLSRRPPRRLGFGPVVAPGTNGGMSPAGTVGGLVGALLVAGTGALLTRLPLLLPAGTLIGFGGMVADSVLGATLQGRFSCPACDAQSDWPVHRCGTRTVHVGGVRWLTNDGVNLLATLAAGLAGTAVWWMSS